VGSAVHRISGTLTDVHGNRSWTVVTVMLGLVLALALVAAEAGFALWSLAGVIVGALGALLQR
jgi:hypothetical protein